MTNPPPHSDPLTELLGQLDEFLRSRRPAVIDALTDFMRDRGHPHPRLAAYNLIDELSFTAHRYQHHSDNTGQHPQQQ